MAPKRKTTNAKQSAHSKRHKTSANSSNKTKKRGSGAEQQASAPSLEASAEKARSSAFPADKPLKESQKKDRKGKGPASIAIVKPSNDSSDEADSGSEGDEGMDVDEELEELGDEQAGFLTRLDEKGMST
jgi:nucleolar complex protein 3